MVTVDDVLDRAFPGECISSVISADDVGEANLASQIFVAFGNDETKQLLRPTASLLMKYVIGSRLIIPSQYWHENSPSDI
jgi:hypothetical protein